jgi:preprotein translocase subunit SecA
LRVLDQNWKDHLLILDHLRQGIGLRGYAQRDPLNEYKQEAFSLFHEMLHRIRESTTALLTHLDLSEATSEQIEEVAFEEEERPSAITYTGPGLDVTPIGTAIQQKGTQSIVQRLAQKKPKKKGKRGNGKVPADIEVSAINRNAPCPCGSGKRYKHCHGKIKE